MFHACTTRFDMISNLEKFWIWGWTTRPWSLSTLLSELYLYLCIVDTTWDVYAWMGSCTVYGWQCAPGYCVHDSYSTYGTQVLYTGRLGRARMPSCAWLEEEPGRSLLVLGRRPAVLGGIKRVPHDVGTLIFMNQFYNLIVLWWRVYRTAKHNFVNLKICRSNSVLQRCS